MLPLICIIHPSAWFVNLYSRFVFYISAGGRMPEGISSRRISSTEQTAEHTPCYTHYSSDKSASYSAYNSPPVCRNCCLSLLLSRFLPLYLLLWIPALTNGPLPCNRLIRHHASTSRVSCWYCRHSIFFFLSFCVCEVSRYAVSVCTMMCLFPWSEVGLCMPCVSCYRSFYIILRTAVTSLNIAIITISIFHLPFLWYFYILLCDRFYLFSYHLSVI